MDRLAHKSLLKERRSLRVRSRISGTPERPRLSVHISNMHVTAQLIDDTKSKTLLYVTSVGRKLDGNMTDKAKAIGTELAAKAKQAKINKVIMDRGPKIYHGRVKALAEVARDGGLEF